MKKTLVNYNILREDITAEKENQGNCQDITEGTPKKTCRVDLESAQPNSEVPGEIFSRRWD